MTLANHPTPPAAVLMYHDLVAASDDDASGFPGTDAARYKVAPELFEAHLRALDAAHLPSAPVLTFDDGGGSALRAADALERYGWRGWFFVTTDRIGARGFLDAAAIRGLHQRGHIVGSHPCSHPLRMAHGSAAWLLREWRDSCAALADIVGEAIGAASVPGGDFGRNVAAAAEQAGLTVLFTSEPTRRLRRFGALTIRGRYTIYRWTAAATAAGLAAGSPLPCGTQAMLWAAKKVTKRIGGAKYLKLRRLLLRHGDEVVWGDRSG